MNKILLVDDDQDILDSLELVLTKEGFEVEILDSPKSIFSLIHRFNPNLILLDICMETFNGLEICKAIKSYYGTGQIPVIVVSSHESIHTAKSEYGATDIVIKPFNISALIRTIKDHLNGTSENILKTN